MTKIIEDLKALDLATIEDNMVLNKVSKLMEGFAARPRLWDFYQIYRSRINKNGTLFDTVERLWYPQRQPEKDLIAGRLNRLNQSIFYGSTDFQTSIFEKKPKVGDLITTMECKFKENQGVFFYCLGLTKVTMDLKSDLKQLTEDEELNKYILENNLDPNRQKIIDSFIHEQFIQDVKPGEEHKYKMTYSISNIFFSNHESHGIIYPSIAYGSQSHALGLNVAIKPQHADSLLYPIKFYVVELVDQVSEFQYKICPKYESEKIEPSGNIIWKGSETYWSFLLHNHQLIRTGCAPHTVATINIGEPNVLINGEGYPMPISANIIRGFTYIPLVYCLVLGFGVSWAHIQEESLYEATLTKDGRTVVFKTGSTTMLINNEPLSIDAPPEMADDNIIISECAMAKALGAILEKDGDTINFRFYD